MVLAESAAASISAKVTLQSVNSCDSRRTCSCDIVVLTEICKVATVVLVVVLLGTAVVVELGLICEHVRSGAMGGCSCSAGGIVEGLA